MLVFATQRRQQPLGSWQQREAAALVLSAACGDDARTGILDSAILDSSMTVEDSTTPPPDSSEFSCPAGQHMCGAGCVDDLSNGRMSVRDQALRASMDEARTASYKLTNQLGTPAYPIELPPEKSHE